MKKKLLLFLVFVSFVSLFLLFNFHFHKNLNVEKTQKVAITVNGSNVSSFPSKGAYSVDVNCNNAAGRWDYENWKLIITDISGKISCDVDFTSITKKKFSNYLISLADSVQGNGEFVNEKSVSLLAGYTFDSIKPKYELVSGIAMKYENGKFVGNDTVSKKETMSKFYITENGYYRICYDVPSSKASVPDISNFYYKNNIYIYIGDSNSAVKYATSNINNGATVSECYNIGVLYKNNYVRVRTTHYDENVSVWFEKTDSYSKSSTSYGYRYEGFDPNNYVWFNNELWRIIGVFDYGTHGVSGANLVKLIRNESIGYYVFNYHQVSAWEKNDGTKAFVHQILDDYYNSVDSTEESYCSAKCNFTNIGLDATSKSMIQSATWKLGGLRDQQYTVYNIYSYERNGWSCVPDNAKLTTTNYLGLMYPSDFMLSVSQSDCSRQITATSFGTSGCAAKSWLKKYDMEWTISPGGNTRCNDDMTILRDGDIFTWFSSSRSAIRPVLYLKSTVYYVSGDGSINNPYIIGID